MRKAKSEKSPTRSRITPGSISETPTGGNAKPQFDIDRASIQRSIKGGAVSGAVISKASGKRGHYVPVVSVSSGRFDATDIAFEVCGAEDEVGVVLFEDLGRHDKA